jgi:ADP-ribose pyrophosphatase YjhB (NUDIX family)
MDVIRVSGGVDEFSLADIDSVTFGLQAVTGDPALRGTNDILRIHTEGGIYQLAVTEIDSVRFFDDQLVIIYQATGEASERFRAELGHITPKVGSDAAIFDDSGRILLMLRADDRTWCLPCGWIEPGESPAEAASREVEEETGLLVHPTELVGLFPRPAGVRTSPHGVISVLYLCDVERGALRRSDEGLELRYWEVDDVPQWHAHHELLARAAQHTMLKAGPKPDSRV